MRIFVRHKSHVTRHTSHVTRHLLQLRPMQNLVFVGVVGVNSCLRVTLHAPVTQGATYHQLQVALHTSHVTRHTSLVTRHTSLVTRHSSLVTHHSSHVTRHSSLVTRHSSLVTPWAMSMLMTKERVTIACKLSPINHQTSRITHHTKPGEHQQGRQGTGSG